MKLNKKLSCLVIVPIALVPMGLVISCGVANQYQQGEGNDISSLWSNFAQNDDLKKNVMSSYFNTTDMLVALGHRPEYVSVDANKTVYADYLKGFLGENNQIGSDSSINTGRLVLKSAPRLMDGAEVDREAIFAADISTILLNEWMKPEEQKFADIVPALIYTTMADGYGLFDDESYGVKNNRGENLKGLNVFESFEMFAKGLDRGYPGNNFLSTSESIALQVQSNIELLHNAVQDQGKSGESVLILEPTINQGDNLLTFNYGYSPGTFNVIYSNNSNRGGGFSVPVPTNTNNLVWGDHFFRAKDVASFKQEFQGKADYVIVMLDPQRSSSEQEIIESNYKAKAEDFLTATSDAKNIRLVNRDEWQNAVWGIYGTNRILQKISDLFNLNVTYNHIAEFANDLELEILR